MSLSIAETQNRIRGVTLSHQILLLLHAAGGSLKEAQIQGRLIWLGHDLDNSAVVANVKSSLQTLLSLNFLRYGNRAWYLSESGENYVTLELIPKLSAEQTETFANVRFQPAFAPREWRSSHGH